MGIKKKGIISRRKDISRKTKIRKENGGKKGKYEEMVSKKEHWWNKKESRRKEVRKGKMEDGIKKRWN